MSGYSIKKPGGTRKTFSVHQRIYQPDGKPLQPLIKDERIDAINATYKANGDYSKALSQIKLVIENLKVLPSPTKKKALKESDLCEYNFQLYDELMKTYFVNKRRKIIRKHTVHNEFKFALRAIEPLSLETTSRETLQNKVEKAFNENQSKRYIIRLNQLLKAANRDFKLQHENRINRRVRHINFNELEKIIQHVTNPDLKNLYYTLFCTGVRLGEAFCIYTEDINSNNSIHIKLQLTEKLKERHTKTRNEHKTIILDEGLKYVEKWAALSRDRKIALRKRCQQPLFHAVRKAFSDSNKHISCHDLRHSYVISLLSSGISIDKCAKLIGDSVRTTEIHYSGFVASDPEIDFVRDILRASKKKVKLRVA